jgi:hypothetical protein
VGNFLSLSQFLRRNLEKDKNENEKVRGARLGSCTSWPFYPLPCRLPFKIFLANIPTQKRKIPTQHTDTKLWQDLSCVPKIQLMLCVYYLCIQIYLIKKKKKIETKIQCELWCSKFNIHLFSYNSQCTQFRIFLGLTVPLKNLFFKYLKEEARLS